MLKHYYSLDESCEFLSIENKTRVSRRDVLELAIRGKIRLCIWFDGDLQRFQSDGFLTGYSLPHPGRFALYTMKGYVKIPRTSISPESECFVFDHAQEIETLWTLDSGGFPTDNTEDEIIGPWKFEPDDPESIAAGLSKIVHTPFVANLEKVLVPTADLLNCNLDRTELPRVS